VKVFDARKTGMIGLPYGKKNYDDMLSRFHTIPACHRRTDGRTDRITISISRVSSRMLTRDNNNDDYYYYYYYYLQHFLCTKWKFCIFNLNTS